MTKFAAIQTVSTPDVARNLAAAARLIAQAAQAGAQWVALPEYFCLMGLRDDAKLDIAEADGDGPIQRFLSGLPLTFQPGKAASLNAVYHFTFTGKEEKQATVSIRDGSLQVQDGHQGEADLRVSADSETWLGFLAKERSLLWALLRRRIRIKGSPKLLVAFGKCFPS